jgi:hypothetical protein
MPPKTATGYVLQGRNSVGLDRIVRSEGGGVAGKSPTATGRRGSGDAARTEGRAPRALPLPAPPLSGGKAAAYTPTFTC